MKYLATKSIDSFKWPAYNFGSNGTLGLLHLSQHYASYAIDLNNLNDWSWSTLAPQKSNKTRHAITLGQTEVGDSNFSTISLTKFPQA
jgi:hypothetical protein